jgi:hypothetical protein
MTGSKISAEDLYQRRKIQVIDSQMAYVDAGGGDPIVPEDSPDAIGKGIAVFLANLDRN